MSSWAELPGGDGLEVPCQAQGSLLKLDLGHQPLVTACESPRLPSKELQGELSMQIPAAAVVSRVVNKNRKALKEPQFTAVNQVTGSVLYFLSQGEVTTL